jgi:hypothetical protein
MSEERLNNANRFAAATSCLVTRGAGLLRETAIIRGKRSARPISRAADALYQLVRLGQQAGLPEPDSPVLAACDDELGVRRDRHSWNRISVPFEHLELTACCDIP